jgi:SAM-dependent methyltransferase
MSMDTTLATSDTHPVSTAAYATSGMTPGIGESVDLNELGPVPVTCPLCASTSGRVKLTINIPDRFERAAGIAADGYCRHWVECLGCGLLLDVYSHDISAIYSDQYYEAAVEGETVSERFERVRQMPAEKSDNAGRVQRVIDFISNTWRRSRFPFDHVAPRVLDIGSGTGIFLYRFLEAAPHWRGTAIEPSPQACAHLRSLSVAAPGRRASPIDVIEGYYRRGCVDEKFHLITLNKVVEHVPKPVELVANAAAALHEHGVMYVEVPDKRTLDLRPSTDNNLGALHYCLFDAQTLARVFERAGLEPLCVERYLEPSGKITVSGFGVRREFFFEFAKKK